MILKDAVETCVCGVMIARTVGCGSLLVDFDNYARFNVFEVIAPGCPDFEYKMLSYVV